MPIYTFECYTDKNGCGHQFSITCLMSEISDKKPKCPQCNKIDTIARNFAIDNVYVGDEAPKTVGALAERNASRMSEDEMNEIKTKGKIQKPKFAGPRPEGSSLLPVDSKGNKIMPKKMMSKEKAKQLQKKFRKAQNG